MSTKFQLELLRVLRQRKSLSTGFTLIELMVVVAILGVLMALAVPRFLNARDAADAGARIGDLVARAKECSVFKASGGVGEAPTDCIASTSGSVYSASWSKTVANLKCLDITTAIGKSIAKVTVLPTGGMSCEFS